MRPYLNASGAPVLSVHLKTCIFLCCRATQKKDEEKQRSYKQKKKRRRIKVQDSSSSNEKVFKMQSTRSQSESVQKFCLLLLPHDSFSQVEETEATLRLLSKSCMTPPKMLFELPPRHVGFGGGDYCGHN